MSYKITDLAELRGYFHSVFGLPVGDYVDVFMTCVLQEIVIDIELFDKTMQKRHPYGDGVSLTDIVHRHYGDEGVGLLDELL